MGPAHGSMSPFAVVICGISPLPEYVTLLTVVLDSMRLPILPYHQFCLGQQTMPDKWPTTAIVKIMGVPEANVWSDTIRKG